MASKITPIRLAQDAIDLNQGLITMKILTYFALSLAICLPSVSHAFSQDFSRAPSTSSVDDMQVEHLRSNQNPGRDGLKVKVYLRNFQKSDAAKIHKAEEILEKVMNSDAFKEAVLAHTFKGERTFHQNNDMSNQEIYDHLMSGAENLMPEADGIMNFDLSLYRSWNPFSKVKGYTKPDTMRIWMNKKFFRKRSWTPIDVAANMAHEWVHKMGFGHDFYNDEERPYSVPYAIGDIVGRLAREL